MATIDAGGDLLSPPPSVLPHSCGDSGSPTTRDRISRLLVRQLPDRIADAHLAGHHDPAIRSSQAELASYWRVDEPQGIVAEARLKLRAAGVWGLAELDPCRADLDPRSRRHVGLADTEIHI